MCTDSTKIDQAVPGLQEWEEWDNVVLKAIMHQHVVFTSSNPQQVFSGTIPCLLWHVASQQSANTTLCSFKVNQYIICHVRMGFVLPMHDEAGLDMEDPFVC